MRGGDVDGLTVEDMAAAAADKMVMMIEGSEELADTGKTWWRRRCVWRKSVGG